MRGLQDIVTGAAPSAELIADATRRLSALGRELQPYVVDEEEQIAGSLFDVPGRGQALAPTLHIDGRSECSQRGRVTFGRFYLGGGGGVHAGAIPLAFSELLFWLAVSGGRSPVRTAYLNVDFRSVTPVEEELQIKAWFDREEGRKRFLCGTLHAGDRLCAEAKALYVAVGSDHS